jgi:hypothetical protein
MTAEQSNIVVGDTVYIRYYREFSSRYRTLVKTVAKITASRVFFAGDDDSVDKLGVNKKAGYRGWATEDEVSKYHQDKRAKASEEWWVRMNHVVSEAACAGKDIKLVVTHDVPPITDETEYEFDFGS